MAGVGEKTAADAAARVRRPGRHPRRGPRPGLGDGTGPRKKLLAAEDYLEVAPTVVAVVRDLDLGDPDLTLPSAPADPDHLAALVERWGLGSSVERLLATLADVTG